MPFKLPYLGLKLKLNTVRMTSRSAVWPLCDLNLRAALAACPDRQRGPMRLNKLTHHGSAMICMII
jgi:hypothetical protein